MKTITYLCFILFVYFMPYQNVYAIYNTFGWMRLLKPSITSISPLYGSHKGGMLLTLVGSNFVNGSQINVCSSVTVISSNTLHCVTNRHTKGSTNVTITTQAGSYTLLNGYMYE